MSDNIRISIALSLSISFIPNSKPGNQSIKKHLSKIIVKIPLRQHSSQQQSSSAQQACMSTHYTLPEHSINSETDTTHFHPGTIQKGANHHVCQTTLTLPSPSPRRHSLRNNIHRLRHKRAHPSSPRPNFLRIFRAPYPRPRAGTHPHRELDGGLRC